MSDLDTSLLQLQHGDSFFPSGSVAFSFGLEMLSADMQVRDAAAVERFLLDQLRSRWATLEWGFLAAAWQAEELDEQMEVDFLVESMTFARGLRVGSKRAGAALLTVHTELGTHGIANFVRACDDSATPGHLSVVQGIAWRGCGLALRDCALVGAHTFCVGVLGAALRLGLIGHLAAQRILSTARPEIVAIGQTQPPHPDSLSAYTPMADIAVMRHETLTHRLFSN